MAKRNMQRFSAPDVVRPPSKRLGLRGSVVLLVMSMLGLTAVSALLVHDARTTLQQVQRQNEFNRADPTLRALIELMLSAKAAQHAYLLTGREDFLADYGNDWKTLAKQVTRSHELFPPQSAEADQLERVARLLQRKKADMDQSVRLYQQGNIPAAVSAENDKVWLGDTDEIRTILNSMIAKGESDKKVLVDHIARGANGAQRLLIAAVTLLLVVLGLTIYQVASLLKSNNRLLERLDRDATQDALTGLANRRLFTDWLGRSVALAKRQRRRLAVVFIDLDGFKSVNDTCGHETGDVLLKHVAKELRASVRQSDLVARLGGDEFAVVATETGDLRELAQLTQRLLLAIRKAAGHDARIAARVTGSIGVAVFPDNGSTAEEVLAQADRAMYQAKKQGKNQICQASEVPAVDQTLAEASCA